MNKGRFVGSQVLHQQSAKSVKILRSVSRKLILLILIQGYFSPNFVINQYQGMVYLQPLNRKRIIPLIVPIFFLHVSMA